MNTTGFLSVLVRLSSMFKISLDNSIWTRIIFYGMLICIQPRSATVAGNHQQQAHPSLFTSLPTTNLTARLRTNNDHRSPQLLRLEDVQRWKRRRRRDVPDVETPSDQDPRCTGFVQSAIINAPPTGSKDHPTSSMVSSLFGRTQKRSKEYRFQTPNYPDFFPHDMQCIKIISAPSKDHRILLNFRGLWELEKEPHCTCDFLEVRDGAFGFSPLLGRYCGRQLPNVGEGLQSSGPYMWLRFRSDSTLAHRGFQAVYRFFQVVSGQMPDVYRLRYRVDMKAGEMWNLDEKFLLKQLHDFPSNWHHLPIEAAFDVRAPNSTFLMVHVANVTVPREFDWSCDPNDSAWQSPKSRCPNENPNIFGTKGGKKSYEEFNDRLDKISIQDPTSIIDGRRTLFEVYPHLSISSYAPPCPKVRRFCDQSVGIANLENNRESERDFFVRNSRVIIRVVIASSAQKHNALISPRSFRRSANEPLDGMKLPTSVQRRVRRQLPANQLPQMPTFQFHITALKRTRPEAFSPCDDNWIACDTETCIPKTFWCDEIINCPQWQDEGLQCDKSNQLSSDDSDRNSLEVRKEREKQEAEEAAQKLHLSILGSLGLLLAVITTTCILMTVRRRKRERVRHIPKIKDNSVRLDGYSTRSGPRLNHVIPTDVLAENKGRLARPDRSHGHSKAMFTLSKSNSAKDRGGIAQTQDMDRKQATESQVTTAWNSTDSVNAPLLWQRKPNKSMKKAMEPKTDEHVLTKWNHIHPDDFIDIPSVRRTDMEHEGFSDGAQIPVVIRSPARMKSRVNSSTGGVRTQPIVPSSDHLMSHLTSPCRLNTSSTRPSSAFIPNQMQLSEPFQTQSVSGVSKMQKLQQIHHQQHSRPVGSRIVSVIPQPKFEIEDGKNVSGAPQWVVGPATMTPPRVHPEPMQPFYTEESMGHEQTTPTGRSLVRVSHPAGRERHMLNCRLISRTQSWGGSLRLAGVDPFCNGEWEVTHSMDSGESPNTLNRLCSRQHPPVADSSVPKKNTGQTVSQFYRLETTGDDLKALQMRHSDWRVVPYVSMPNVTSLMTKISSQPPSFDEPGTKQNVSIRQNELTIRDFKPPLAKRPRMVAPAVGESKWVATSYLIDTEDDDLSTGTATVDEFGSIRSELVYKPVTQPSQNDMFSYPSAQFGTETSKRLYGKHSLPFRPEVGHISYGFRPVESSAEDRMSTHSSMGTASRTMSIGQSDRDSSGGSECNEEEEVYKTFRNVSQNDYSTESEAQINNDPLARRNPMTRINVDVLSNVLPNQSSSIREQMAVHGTRDGSLWSGRGPARPTKQRLAQANLVYEYEA